MFKLAIIIAAVLSAFVLFCCIRINHSPQDEGSEDKDDTKEDSLLARRGQASFEGSGCR